MKTFAAGAVVVVLLMLANVVAAGVFTVLGPLVLELQDEWSRVVAVALIGVVAVVCALVFLRGALFLALENPFKGLKSAAGRRGG